MSSLAFSHLENADLTSAYLRKAILRGAYLNGANFKDAHLDEAKLDLAHLEGVDLSSATGLKQEQVNAAKGSADTKLPLGLCLPKNWTAVGPNTPNACPATK